MNPNPNQPFSYHVENSQWVFRKNTISTCRTLRHHDTLHIQGLYTDPMYRRQGHATSLLKYIIKELQDKVIVFGITKICLYRSANTSIYRQLGFEGDIMCSFTLPIFDTIAFRVRQKNRIHRFERHNDKGTEK